MKLFKSTSTLNFKSVVFVGRGNLKKTRTRQRVGVTGEGAYVHGTEGQLVPTNPVLCTYRHIRNSTLCFITLDWLAGRITYWQLAPLLDWLIDWLTNSLTANLIEWTTAWRADWLLHWLIDWFTHNQFDWLLDWLAASLADWLQLIYWLKLIDWSRKNWLYLYNSIILLYSSFMCRSICETKQQLLHQPIMHWIAVA